MNIPLDRRNATLMVTWGLPDRIRIIAVNIPLDWRNATLMVTWGLPDRIRIIAVNIPLDRLNATSHLGASCSYLKHSYEYSSGYHASFIEVLCHHTHTSLYIASY